MAPPLQHTSPTITCFRLLFADPEETAAFLRARLPDSHRRGFLWPPYAAPRAPYRPGSSRLRLRLGVRKVLSAGAGTAAATRPCIMVDLVRSGRTPENWRKEFERHAWSSRPALQATRAGVSAILAGVKAARARYGRSVGVPVRTWGPRVPCASGVGLVSHGRAGYCWVAGSVRGRPTITAAKEWPKFAMSARWRRLLCRRGSRCDSDRSSCPGR